MSEIIPTCMQHVFPEKVKYCNLRNIRSKLKSEDLEIYWCNITGKDILLSLK
jgi:hypothetical protein